MCTARWRMSGGDVRNHGKPTAILHSGDKRHGADDIGEGERVNLIVWNLNSRWERSADKRRRDALRPAESAPPDPGTLLHGLLSSS